MVSQLLGEFLVKKRVLTRQQFSGVLEAQSKVRVKLGLIAVAEGMLTVEQADAINHLQQAMDKRFGDIAVEKGYLTDLQVGSLLRMQGNEYLSFAQTLVDMGFLTMEMLGDVLKDYQSENGFTNTEMEAIKSGEAEKIVPLFLPPGAERYEEIVTLALKTLIRFVDNKAYVMYGTLADRAALRYPVTQELQGAKYIRSGFSDVDEGICELASVFARSVFETVDEDVQDAVGEFLNCVNGLYATAQSQKGISLELMPPQMGKSGEAEGRDILVMPFGICGKRVEFMVTDSSDWR